MHRLCRPQQLQHFLLLWGRKIHCRPGSGNDATDASSDVSKSSCFAGNYGQHRSADDSADSCSTYCHLGLIEKRLPGITNLCGGAKEIAGEHSRVHRAGNSGSSGVRCRYLGLVDTDSVLKFIIKRVGWGPALQPLEGRRYSDARFASDGHPKRHRRGGAAAGQVRNYERRLRRAETPGRFHQGPPGFPVPCEIRLEGQQRIDCECSSRAKLCQCILGVGSSASSTVNSTGELQLTVGTIRPSVHSLCERESPWVWGRGNLNLADWAMH